MAKPKAHKTYVENLWQDIEEQRGERPRMLRHMVDKTAKDQRHLDIIDAELEDAEMTSIAIGSTGQQKTEINPLLAHRDKVSRTITDDLKELQLTAGSVYKKKEQRRLNDEDKENDPTAEYFNSIGNG